MAAVHRKGLVAALILGMLTTGCDTSPAPESTAATNPPVTIGPPSPALSGGGASPAAQQSTFPHANAPIRDTTVSSIVQAWATHWHATPKPYVAQGAHSTRLTVDFPVAHGKLFMSVGQLTPDATAASKVYCEITDPSLGQTRFITLTGKAVEQFVSGCAGPVLTGNETKQVINYVTKHDKPDKTIQCTDRSGPATCRYSDDRVDLGRFQLVVQTIPSQIRMYLLGR